MTEASVAIGIDLGTSNCCVAYLGRNDNVEIIDNEFGDRTTPSYVAFTIEKEIIGKLAKESILRDPENVIYDAKRLIGRKFLDQCLQQNFKLWPFQVVCDSKDDTPLIRISPSHTTCSYKPYEISAKLLKYMKEIAEKRLGKEVQSAVITVPAYFNYHQRTATKEAGQLAGLNVLKIINEPTAAALAYIHKREITECENLLVVDIGGGTLDVSIVTVRGKSVTVKATAGNTHLGGRDFDNNLIEFVANEIKQQYNIDVRDKKTIMQLIKTCSEKLKMDLSCQHIAFFYLMVMNGRDINVKISRTDFEVINNQLFNSCIKTVERCLTLSNIQKSDINKILLIGGSCRIPKLQHLLKNLFNGNAELINAINPEEAVAYGAAIQASMYSNCNKTDVIELKDITPLSLGVDVEFDEMVIIIPRNTEIPVARSSPFCTACNNIKEIEFNIYEGERDLVTHNTDIGQVIIELPPSRPVGFPVELLFRLDENGILEVEAKLDGGHYIQLAIKYEKHAEQKINDILRDAIEHRSVDNKVTCAIQEMSGLYRYCQRMEAMCLYKTKHISEIDRDIINTIAKDVLTWVEDNHITDGTTEEVDAILQKQKEIEAICEPIMKKYQFSVKNMTIKEFYEFASES